MGCGASNPPPPPSNGEKPDAKESQQSMASSAPKMKRTKTVSEPFIMPIDKETEGARVVKDLLREGVEADTKLMKDPKFRQRCMDAAMRAQKGDSSGMQALKQDSLQRRTKLHKQTLTKLWDVYDKNGDGELSVAENRGLMRDYFDGTYVILTETMVDLITDGLKMTLSMLKQQGLSHEALDDMFEEKVPLIQEHVPKILVKTLQAFDNAAAFDEVLKGMDTNSDGKVDKDEFLSKFMESTNTVIDPDVLSQKVSSELQRIIGG
mmetsp:Transcript_11415/g.18296  ORF Transcript_11415/g.18296 Transcript_11415/m.18296 type:complete len:264 (+) Transcript_11415:26-817(+)